MGMVVSADVADLAFWKCGEEKALSRANSGLLKYFRYRDDILCALGRKHYGKARFVARNLALDVKQIYSVSVDAVSKDSIDYLDVSLTLVESPQYCLFRKPSGQKRPLSSASGHPPRVLASWPLGEVLRLWRRSSMRDQFQQEKERFIRHLREHYLAKGIIEAVKHFDPTTEKPKQHRKNNVWFTLPYHPTVYRLGLTSLADKLAEKWRGVIGDFGIALSWRGANPNVMALARQIFAV